MVGFGSQLEHHNGAQLLSKAPNQQIISAHGGQMSLEAVICHSAGVLVLALAALVNHLESLGKPRQLKCILNVKLTEVGSCQLDS